MYNNLHWQKILTHYITGNSSEKERQQVKDWISENPKNREKFEKLLETWKKTGQIDLNYDEEQSWNKILTRISSSERESAAIYELNQSTFKHRKLPVHKSSDKVGISNFNWLLRIAAILLVAAGISYVVLESHFRIDPDAENSSDFVKVTREIVTKAGEKASVTFSDGTEVILNSESVLRFPEKFIDNRREVELLEGEAFFSVTNKGNNPFLVHTNYADVRVLGTKFNVNAHRQNKRLEVVVAEGKVAVRSAEKKSEHSDAEIKAKEVVLAKGEYVDVEQSGLPTAPRKVKLKSYLGWVNGMLVFEEDPLEKVLSRLSSYYNVKIEVSDTTLYNRHLTAVFTHESLSKVLEVVALSTDMNYIKNNGKIIFQPK